MNHECRLWAALEQQQQQEEEAIYHQARTPPSTSSAPTPLRPAAVAKPGAKPMRTGRGSGNKDRHSKVQTARGPRDRRVRLSVSTAIQFYDIQDRLGFDQPSKAIEWLLKMAKPAINELYHSPATAAKTVGSVSKQEQDKEPEAEGTTREQPPVIDMVQFESTKLESLDSSACLPAAAAAAEEDEEQLKVEQAAAAAARGNLTSSTSSRMLMRSEVSFTQLLQAPISAEIIPQHSLFRSPQFFATLSQQSPSPPPPRLCFGPSEQNVQQQQQQQQRQESRHFHHQQQHRHHVAGTAGVQKYYSAEIDQEEQQQQVPRHSATTSLASLSASSSHHHLHLQQLQHHPQQQQEHGWKHFEERHQAQQLLPAPGPSFSFRRMIPARIQGLEGIDEQLEPGLPTAEGKYVHCQQGKEDEAREERRGDETTSEADDSKLRSSFAAAGASGENDDERKQ